MSQVKSKNVYSQEMYGYGSLLVLITPFIEYVLKVTFKIIFHHSKTVCKIYNLSIMMAVRSGGGHTKSYVLSIGQEQSEFRQEKVRRKSGNLIDSQVWEPGQVKPHAHMMTSILSQATATSPICTS